MGSAGDILLTDITDLSIRRPGILRLLSRAAVLSPVALAAMLHMERPALAGSCTPGPTSVCSGPSSGADTTQQIIDAAPVTVTTDSGFGLDVTDGGYGFDISGLGGATFTDTFSSIITTNGAYGIYAQNNVSGNLSIVSTGSLISTDTTGDGIRTYNSGADTLVQVHDTQGNVNGVNISHNGTGAIHVVSTGTAIGLNSIGGGSSTGISVYGNDGTSLTIEAFNTQGAFEGIYGWNDTSGALVITSTGLATGTSGRGILAHNHIGGTDVTVTAVDTWGGNVGLQVNNYGSGALQIDSTGTARGGTGTGIRAFSASSSTSATINAVDTYGFGGLYAVHGGTGAVTVTSTGTAMATSATGHGISVTTNNSSAAGLNVTANNAQGGQHGIRTAHGSAAGTPDNAATITVTGNIHGGTGYGIATESAAGVLTTINVAASAVVESTAGNGISNDDGDSHVDIAAGGTVNGRVELGDGNDTITLRGSLSGITVLDGGGGGTDVLNLSDAANVVHAGSDIQNWSVINLDNSRVTLTGGGVAVGTAGDMTTGIFLRNGSTLDGSQDNFSLAGNMSLAAGTRFIASGNGNGTNAISGNVANAGLMTAAGGGAGDRIRIAGDYAGNGGTVVLETQLGDDTSATDKLEIAGDTSGTSSVRVINANGLGASTNEGIEIITVAGASDGVFNLLGDYQVSDVPMVVAGAYAYRLNKGNKSGTETNNWYLLSELFGTEEPLYQPGVPVYEAYPQALLGLNTLPTLQQRVGNRSWLNAGNPAPSNDGGALDLPSGASVSDSGAWARIEGVRNSIDPRSSTAGSGFEQNTFKAQAGIDGPLHDSANGALLGGITGHYSHGIINTHSTHGDGRISTSGYGLGGTLTWYGYDGFYIDGQAQATWYESDLSSLLANRSLVSGNDAFGYAVSLEGGQRVAIRHGWSITPQAQLVYSHVDFDNFVDAFGAPVSLDKGASLQSRLGLTLDREASWQDANGKTSRVHAYGIANLYYELLDGTRVDVDGQNFDFEKDRFWGGLGVGGSHSWNDGAYTLYAEGLINTSLANIGDSYSLQGKAGGRILW